MRQNVIIALLAVCSTLLAVNLAVMLLEEPAVVLGQGGAGGATVATGQAAVATSQGTSQEPWCFVYDVAMKRLAAYRVGNRGIELRGARNITWDLQLEELSARAISQAGANPIPVNAVKAQATGGGAGGTSR